MHNNCLFALCMFQAMILPTCGVQVVYKPEQLVLLSPHNPPIWLSPIPRDANSPIFGICTD